MRTLFALTLMVAAALLAPAISGRNAFAAPQLLFHAECTPGTIRPNSEALFTCATSITNAGDATATSVTVSGNLAPGLSLPSFELFDRAVDGVPVPAGQGQITYDMPDVSPGQTVNTVGRVIFGVRDPGSYGFRLELHVNGAVAASADQSFEATATSPYPPTRLAVTKTLAAVLPEPGPVSPPQSLSPPNSFPLRGARAEYDIVVRNQSTESIGAITVWDRHDQSTVLASSDPPASNLSEQTRVASWQFGSGLAPGDSVRVRIALEPGAACGLSLDTVVISATVPNGQESYVGRPDRAVTLGSNCSLGQGGDGLGPDARPAITLPGTGSPSGDRGFMWIWPLVAAAAVGVIGLCIGAYRSLR